MGKQKQLVWDETEKRWVPMRDPSAAGVPPHQHQPQDIVPQGSGSGLDADTLDGQHASDFALASHVHPLATATEDGFLSAQDKAKLDTIEAGAQVNQDAFSQVQVGSTTLLVATTPGDLFRLDAGYGISVTGDASTKTATIGLNPTYYSSGTAGSVTINSTSVITIASLSIPAGVYLVIGTSSFRASTTTAATLTFYLLQGSTVLASVNAGSWSSSHGPLSLTIPYIGTLSAGTLSIGATTSNSAYPFTAQSSLLIALRIA